MASILSSIMFIKSVSGTRALTGVAICRVEDQKYVEVNYKASRADDTDNSVIHGIENNRIMSVVGKLLFSSGKLYVSVPTTMKTKYL